MGILMIRCSKTGRAISTGRHAPHEWFAGDAWVCESDEGEHGRQHFDTSMMSAYPSRSDILCRVRDVRFVPIADAAAVARQSGMAPTCHNTVA